MSEKLLDQLNDQQFINLETLRKNDTRVQTPVWFTQEGEVLYVHTIKNSSKMKHIKTSAGYGLRRAIISVD